MKNVIGQEMKIVRELHAQREQVKTRPKHTGRVLRDILRLDERPQDGRCDLAATPRAVRRKIDWARHINEVDICHHEWPICT